MRKWLPAIGMVQTKQRRSSSMYVSFFIHIDIGIKLRTCRLA